MRFPIVTRDSRDSVLDESILVVFKSGDFMVLPNKFYVNFKKQVFRSPRARVSLALGWVKTKTLPHVSGILPLYPVLFAWLTLRRWRLSPTAAVFFRKRLVSMGFSLLYIKDDLYRVCFFRRKSYVVEFSRGIPRQYFEPCDPSRLNHTLYSGYKIYFNEKA